ncbi:HipA domain-containing protein [uncultured Christiangramia sp.]|uniref:type II toxin-antitoxin system HipA family toxin n=1 Tax=uncultured Christiangramia sp. TaxID=503836 RepID=UPI0026030473|nr:HipA domain-containing protein [uncultured Christiangramia sp.]
MAIACGIDLKPSRLLEENGRAHFMNQRLNSGKQNQKHDVQTFCLMQHYDFNDVNSYSYEQLFQRMRILGLPYPQAEEIYRRMVFNVLAQNWDDHTKNFAFLIEKDKNWSIASAYDVCYAYSSGSTWVHQHALSFRGKRTDITRESLQTIGKSMNIDKMDDIINRRLDEMKDWNDYASEVSVNSRLKNKIQNNLTNHLTKFEGHIKYKCLHYFHQ